MSLTSLQRELARRVSALEGAAEGGADAFLRSDRGVPAEERLEVYAHAYFARLHDTLREDHPALHAALGDAGFHDLARLYLIAHPPASFTLRVLGARLPGFLASPAAEFFRARWPFAADLATLEQAIADVFDAPDSPVLVREALASVAPDAWPGLRFALVPAQRRLALAWPVERLRAAHDAGEPTPALEPAPTRVLVHRRDERVQFRALDADEAEALDALASGEDFASACARFADPARVLEHLERWLAEGLLSALVR